MSFFLTPAASSYPALPPGVRLLCMAYEATESRVPYGLHMSMLDCIASDGRHVYKPDAVDEVAARYYAEGIDRIAIDWEEDAGGKRRRSPADLAAFRQVMWRLEDRGLTVHRFGAEPWLADKDLAKLDNRYTRCAGSRTVGVIAYPFGPTEDLWEKTTRTHVAVAQSAFPGWDVDLWICPFHSNPTGEGPQTKVKPGDYVGESFWRRMLRLPGKIKGGGVDGCVWVEKKPPADAPPTVGYGAIMSDEPWFRVLGEEASK